MLFRWSYSLINIALTVFLVVGPTVYLLILICLFKDELKKSLPQLGLFFLLTAVFLNKLLFGSESLAQQDFNNIQIPFFHFFAKSVSHLHPPIWNTAFCGGFDNFASPLAGYFSVFNWVFLLGDSVYKSFNVFIFVQIFLCLLFAYLMLRVFSFSKAVSVLGAVLFTFNGFVTMRLSPGVGIEYLFAYKWLPLIFAFSKRFFEGGKTLDLLGLSITLAFSLEGNPSMVIAIGVLWVIYILFEYKRLVLGKFKVFLAPLFGFFVYALKILPVADFFVGDDIRFVDKVGGWRAANFDLYMFPDVFFPVKLEFTNGIFTPGVIGITLFFVGLLLAFISFGRTKKPPFEGFYFMLTTFVLAFFLTIENPLYYFFYSLPVLNKTTIIPPFLIFYVFPIVFFGSYGFSLLLKLLKMFRLQGLVAFLIPLAVFAEVLLGPSTFGNSTYSFNFAKMDYTKEPFDFPHYNLLKRQEEGVFFVTDNPSLFVYPYAISLLGLETLNSPNYFFGCNSDLDLSNAGLAEVKRRTDYVVAMYPLQDSELEFIDVVSLSIMLKHKSHAVFERMAEYLSLYETNWNDDLYVYKVKKAEQGFPTTNYSKWLRVKGAKGFLSTHKDAFGYLEVDGDLQEIEIFYVNPLIYLGFGLSLVAFILSTFYFVKLCWLCQR